MSESSPGTGFVDLRRSAAVIGHLAWVELRLFELLGGWVHEVPELEVKLALAKQSYHHAWHAELLQDRLPSGVGLPAPNDLVQPANDATVALVGRIAAASTAETTIEKLVGVVRVLVPLKIAAYEAWLDSSSPVADGPLRRAIGFILIDETADRDEGEALLDTLLEMPGGEARAAAWAAHLGLDSGVLETPIAG